MMRKGNARTAVLALALLFLPGGAAAQEHFDVEIYSTAPGGGTLVATGFDFATTVVETTCSLELGGECVFYSTPDPGFMSPTAAPPGLFALGETTVSMELVAVDAPVSVKFGPDVIDTAGQSAAIGDAPDLHVHPSWQLSTDDGLGEFNVEFRYTAPGYDPSAVETAVISNAPEGDDRCGDPDGDEVITEDDADAVFRAALGLSSLCVPTTCDVNADGVIDEADGVNVLRAARELEATLECSAE